MTFQLGKQPAFLATYDWRFTQEANRTFQDKCYQALADAQVKGRGHFLTAEPHKLEKAMIDGIHEADYIKVANYAMMLHTQQQVEKEKEVWETQNYKTEPSPEDDDLSFD